MNRLGLTLWVGFFPVLQAAAAPPAEHDSPAPTEQQEGPSLDLQIAQALFDRGVSHYVATEYKQAIALWIEADSKIPLTANYRQMKAELIYNIATAQQKWFGIDQDIRHLRQAKQMLATFADEISSIYPEDEASQEQARAQETLSRLDDDIRRSEQDAEKKRIASEERARPKFDPVVDERERRRNFGMIGSGAVLLGLGLAGVSTLIAGTVIGNKTTKQLGTLETEAELDERGDVLRRGQLSNRLLIVGATVGAVGVLVGLPLLIAGGTFESRRKKHRSTLSVGPGPGWGAAATVRF